MEARLVVFDNRLKQTEEVMVMERLAQRFAESAQMMVGTQSAGIEKSPEATGLVGAKETGEPPTSSGESGLSCQAGDITLHLWSLILWSCLGAFEQVVTGLLRNMVAKEGDPAFADRVNMMDRKRRLQVQLYHMITMTCRRRVSLVVRRVFSSGLEARKQLCRVFQPRVSSRFQWMFQAPLPSTRSDSSVRQYQRQSGVRTSKNAELAVLQSYLCNGEPARQPGLQSGSPTMMCDLACDEIAEHMRAASEVVERTNLSPHGRSEGSKMCQDRGKGVKTAKPKECFCCVLSSHNKNEYKNLPAAVKRKFAQRGRANRHASKEVESESDERQCLRGTSMASPAHELGVCFLHGSDDGPHEDLLPLPVIEKSDDDHTRQMRSDVSAVKQVEPPAFKPDAQIEPLLTDS